MVYNLLKAGLDVSALRQETISSNISNVNTPDYKASRVEFEGHLKNAMNNTGLKRTHENHFNTFSMQNMVVKQEGSEVQDNGNNVDIDYEMSELSANNIYYDSIVSQLNAKYAMVRSVIK